MSNTLTAEQEALIKEASEFYYTEGIPTQITVAMALFAEKKMQDVLSNPSRYALSNPLPQANFYQVCTCPVLKDTCPIHGRQMTSVTTSTNTITELNDKPLSIASNPLSAEEKNMEERKNFYKEQFESVAAKNVRLYNDLQECLKNRTPQPISAEAEITDADRAQWHSEDAEHLRTTVARKDEEIAALKAPQPSAEQVKEEAEKRYPMYYNGRTEYANIIDRQKAFIEGQRAAFIAGASCIILLFTNRNVN